MLLQVASEKFEGLNRFEVRLPSPSAAQTVVVLALTSDRSCALRVSDNGSGRWGCANDSAGGQRWVRAPAPQGGVTEITVATVDQRPVTGAAFAAEIGGCSPGQALQQLDDLLTEAAA